MKEHKKAVGYQWCAVVNQKMTFLLLLSEKFSLPSQLYILSYVHKIISYVTCL